jgi:hypothetical protein
VSDNYNALTDGEAAHWDEYTRLRALSDWPAFTDEQRTRKDDARLWLDERRGQLWHDLNSEPVDDAANDANNRRARYEQLTESSLNSGSCRRVCQLPTDAATDSESVLISERETWWRVTSTTDAQKARKQACTDWLVERRQYVWALAEGTIEGETPGWDVANRNERYANLQIATKYGNAYDDWCKTHDTTTGEPKSSSSWRDKSAKWHESHLGITESPADSNCDSRSDGIRTSQDGCANGTWLRYQPWCGCWAWSGLYAAGKVSKGDSWLASVASIEDYARAGNGPFKAWTTDGSKARKGDLVVLFGRGQHVGTVRDVDDAYVYTYEGNTSGGSSGSQSNGGGSYERKRSRSSETYGYALVKD